MEGWGCGGWMGGESTRQVHHQKHAAQPPHSTWLNKGAPCIMSCAWYGEVQGGGRTSESHCVPTRLPPTCALSPPSCVHCHTPWDASPSAPLSASSWPVSWALGASGLRRAIKGLDTEWLVIGWGDEACIMQTGAWGCTRARGLWLVQPLPPPLLRKPLQLLQQRQHCTRPRGQPCTPAATFPERSTCRKEQWLGQMDKP